MSSGAKWLVKLLFAWLKSRRAAIAYFIAFTGILFLVYGLYGYAWGAAGYTALLGIVVGAAFAVEDLKRFASSHHRPQRLAGRFPLGDLP